MLDRLTANHPPATPTGQANASQSTQPQNTASKPGGPASSAPPATPRQGRPSWVPAGWKLVVDRPAGELWHSQDEAEGGRCAVYGEDLRVTRDSVSGLTGCTIMDPLQPRFTDTAVEVEVTVTAGCAGLWSRTGQQGYFVTVCRSAVRVYLLGDQAPANANQLANWPLDSPPQHLVVGMLTQASQITVYAAGTQLGAVTESTLRYGHVNAGAYTSGSEPADATFHGFRVWSP
jgi:hypothetical protein